MIGKVSRTRFFHTPDTGNVAKGLFVKVKVVAALENTLRQHFHLAPAYTRTHIAHTVIVTYL
jgi:hypothetical protein